MTRFVIALEGTQREYRRGPKTPIALYISGVSFNAKGKGIVKFSYVPDKTKAQTFAKFMADDIAAQLNRVAPGKRYYFATIEPIEEAA
jgi:hypothetical protein